MRKITLHMHDIQNFIDDRYSFYQQYVLKQEPRYYNFKGVKKAFEIGLIIDENLKNHYLGIEPKHITGNLINRTDQVIISASLQAYKKIYNQEYFHDYYMQEFKIPFDKFILLGNADLLCYTFHENDLVVIEIKTKAQEVDTQETLNFQTMFYCWASFRWNFKIPKYVIKRTIKKIRLKQKQKETLQEYHIRILDDVTENPEKYIESNSREITKDMVYEFEKYLKNILKEMYTCLNSKDKYKFYKNSSEYWG